MLYTFTRIIFTLIIALIVIFTFKKCIHQIKRKHTILLAFTILIVYLSSFFIPFENYIVNFESPEKAFKYRYFNTNIIRVVEEENCAFIFYGEDGSSVSFAGFEKKEGRWKVPNQVGTYKEKSYIVGHYFVDTIEVQRDRKKMIIISDGNLQKPESNMKIGDNYNSQFTSFYCKYKYADYYTVFYYTVIDSSLQNYCLDIDGKVITIKSDNK